MKHRRVIVLPVSLLLAARLLFGICLPAVASTQQESFQVYSPSFGEESAYGYVEPRWVDENGNEFNPLSLSAPSKAKAKSTASVLPSSYDSRNAGNITSVKYQSDANICWAFTAMGVLEAYDISHGYATLADTDYSETHLAWFTNKSLSDNTADPTHGDGFNRDTPYLYGGNTYYAVGTLARWSGIADEADFPFDTENYATNCVYVESERYANNGRLLRSMEQLTDTNEVKQAIIDNGAVEAAICYEDGVEAYAANGDCVYYSPSTDSTNHAIIIVGWNDNYPTASFPAASRPSSPGAWLIRNSWSQYWGNEGYMWVSYETASFGDFTVYTAMSAANYDNNYQYDGFGISHNYFYSATDASIANVFTAKGDETLKSVCFYTVSQNTSCTIKVYKSIINSYTNPTQGILAYTSPLMTFANTGYRTIDLDEEITLEADEIFSVVISLSGTAVFPVEPTPDATTSPAFSSNERESYYSLGSYSWNDMVGTDTAGNLPIKALTKNNVTAPQLVANTSFDEFMQMFSIGIREFFALLFANIFIR